MKSELRWFLAVSLAALALTAGAASSETLTAEQIVERYVAARGGAEAWRQVQTMGWSGRIESGPPGTASVPFLMWLKRPNATHFEITSQGRKSVRIFDGSKGWKARPTGPGGNEVKDYTAAELSSAGDAYGLDGPLFDYKEKGVTVVLDGKDSIEGHEAYRLRVKLPSGQAHTDWIDAHSFLELKYDRATRTVVGQTGVVSVHYRDYQTVNGLVIPFTIETGGTASTAIDRMIIEKIAINPVLEAATFSRPAGARRRPTVRIDAPQPAGGPGQ